MRSSIAIRRPGKRGKFNTEESGQSLVELALVLIFILILLAGVVDLGRMMYEYLTMRDAAQEGAGYAAVFPSYCADTINRVASNLPDNSYGITVLIDGQSCESAWSTDKTFAKPKYGCEGKDILVTITHGFNVTMPFISEITGPTVPMRVEIKGRIVRPECFKPTPTPTPGP